MEEKMSKRKRVYRRIKKRQTWQLISLVLFALLITAMFTGGFRDFFGGTSFQKGIGVDKAGEESMAFINDNILQGRSTATLKEITELDSLYQMTIEISGQEFDSYITKDGRYLFPQGIDLEELETEIADEETSPATGSAVQECGDTPTSEKPVVEAFVMSHCPYGTQIEKGLLPVVDLLGDAIDFNVRFVYYAMHGEVEVNEQLNQYCIQRDQKEKLTNYLECFLEDGDSETCLTSTEIDMTKLESCVTETDAEFQIKEKLADQSTWLNGRFPLFDIDKELNTKYGVRGSPQLVVNGQAVSAGRDSASLLNAICCGFDEKPAGCDETLSSASPSPGFGMGTTGGSTGGGCAT